MGDKPLIPFLFPWKDKHGITISIQGIIKSRIFSLTYILIIALIWYFLGYGHWGCHRCETFGQQLACACAIWPNKMFTAPHEYLLSFFTSPFFHNDFQHIIFIMIGVVIFFQSFEARAGTKSTIVIFFSSIAFTCLIIGLIMNSGHLISPENELFSGAMSRCWMGGSIGMMGIIGALSHHSSQKWLIPTIVILFEIWNRYENGMNEYITMGHLTSALFGFVVWGWYLSNHEKSQSNDE